MGYKNLLTEFLSSLQSLLQRTSVSMALCSTLQDLHKHEKSSEFANKNKLTVKIIFETLLDQMTYISDVQRVACDPLHRFQEEARQRHSLTPVVCGDFLTEIRDIIC